MTAENPAFYASSVESTVKIVSSLIAYRLTVEFLVGQGTGAANKRDLWRVFLSQNQRKLSLFFVIFPFL